MKTDRRRFLLSAAALAALPTLTRAAGAAPRVIALEYHAVEMALALGVTPVGVADPKGYARWVGVGKEKLAGATNVGSRQQPSLELMAKLKPDLIVAVDFRHAALKPLLNRIAPTLMLDSPEDDGLASVYADHRRVGAALGRIGAADAAIAEIEALLGRQRDRLAAAGWGGRALAILQSMGGVPQMWAFTGNSVPGGIQKSLGLTGPWLGMHSRQGVDTKTVEDLLTLDATIALLGDGRPASDRTPVWRQVPAVKAGRLLEIPPGLWPFGGPVSTLELVRGLSEGILGFPPPRS